MEDTRFIGLDIHKERISVAVAQSGRSGTVEYLGEIINEPGAISKLCDRLRRPGKPLAFCYEAGPCGYGVHRQLTSLGHRCDVVAPSLIPTKAGDRVKTNRRDATMLARLHRAGELTPVWVPDADHEAMRDLIRLRSVIRQIVTRARQHLQGFLLRHGRKHGGGTAWRMAYRRWLSTLAFEHPAQQIAFQDYVDAVTDAKRQLKRSRGTDLQPPSRLDFAPRCRRLAGDAGDRTDQCRGAGHGSRRLHTLLKPAPAHGLFRPGPGRAIEWRDSPARRHHQDRQRPMPGARWSKAPGLGRASWAAPHAAVDSMASGISRYFRAAPRSLSCCI